MPTAWGSASCDPRAPPI